MACPKKVSTSRRTILKLPSRIPGTNWSILGAGAVLPVEAPPDFECLTFVELRVGFETSPRKPPIGAGENDVGVPAQLRQDQAEVPTHLLACVYI